MGLTLRAYWATPLLLAAALLDLALQDGRWGASLPTSPMALPGYALVFGMPHILASFFAFADPALARASAPVLRPSLAWAALGAVIVGPFTGQAWADGAIIGATMVHVLGQQTGLAIGQARLGEHPAVLAPTEN